MYLAVATTDQYKLYGTGKHEKSVNEQRKLSLKFFLILDFISDSEHLQ